MGSYESGYDPTTNSLPNVNPWLIGIKFLVMPTYGNGGVCHAAYKEQLMTKLTYMI